MRAIERTTQFKRDFKREMKGRHRTTLETDLTAALRARKRRTVGRKVSRPSAVRRVVGISRLPRQTRPCADLLKAGHRYVETVRLGSHSELGWRADYLTREPARRGPGIPQSAKSHDDHSQIGSADRHGRCVPLSRSHRIATTRRSEDSYRSSPLPCPIVRSRP